MKDEHTVRFREWVQGNTKVGINGDNEECPYVPPRLLDKYWDTDKVRQVLDDCGSQGNAAQITKKFLRIFSTLVHLGQPQKITLFTSKNQDDVQLPIVELPYEKKTVLADFWNEQWMFCPLEFNKDDLIFKRELDTRQILPVTYMEPIRGHAWAGEGPTIEKVQIHAECNTMTELNTPVVFKVFKGPEMEKLYKTEAIVYSRLSEKQEAQETITKHYGSFSFEATDTRIIILEYAEMGSLLDFFEKTSPPVKPKDFKLLWEAMLGLLTGLYAFHNLDKDPVEGEPIAGFTAAIHQDIHPANILVFPGPENSTAQKSSRFNVRFKLADFGLAELRRVAKPGEQFKIENADNRMYSAPECYVNYGIQSEVPLAVTAKIDVWALGAVYSDVLVWSLSEEDGREEYRTSRMNAIKPLKHIKGRGFDACFHDGRQVLQVVSEFHNKVLKDKRESDHISPMISDLILSEMLRVSKSRSTADTLMARADELMQGLGSEADASTLSSSQIPPTSRRAQMTPVGNEGMVPKNNESRSSRARSATPPRNRVPPKRVVTPTTTHKPAVVQAPVDKMYEKLVKKKRKTLSFGKGWGLLPGRQLEGSFEFQEMESARREIKVPGGRDQIILIDDFASMEKYEEQIARTAKVISYVTKVADNDGMDLYFASEPTRSYKHKTSSTVESDIRKMKFTAGKCNMKNCLLKIIKSVFKDGKNFIKPTSIYIYTDGNWDDANEVKSVIKQSIHHLVKANEDPSTLMFQFIQFGNDNNGSECLRKLDDDCKEEHELGEYDIVDTKRWDDEIDSIVIGSILKANDNKKTTAPGHSELEKVP